MTVTAQEKDHDLTEALLLLMVTRIHLRTFKRKPDVMTISYYLRLLNVNCNIDEVST